MITIFNRRELVVTYAMARQAEIRALLAQNAIAYTIKTRGQNDSVFRSSDRARIGTAGINIDHQYSYTFYVHKNDYPRAMYLIGQ